MNSVVLAVHLAVSQLATEMWKNFQGVPKVDGKSDDKTVKSVCDPKEASRKWTKTRTPPPPPSALGHSEKRTVCESLQIYFWGRGGIFLGE